MNPYIIYKLISESFLSFYPTLIKNLNIPQPWPLFSRLFIYTLVSLFLINLKFIRENLFTKDGISLGLVTLIHAAASFRAFQIIDGGVAITLGYLYPFFILLLSGEQFHSSTLFFVIALSLFIYEAEMEAQKKNKEIQQKKETFDPTVLRTKEDIEDKKKEHFKFEGFLMIFINVITEAFIYFLVKRIKTDNSWNVVFISYLLPLIIIMGLFIIKPNLLKFTYMVSKEAFEPNHINNEQSPNKNESNENTTSLYYPLRVLGISLAVNALIGATGYYLRFLSINHIPTTLYAYLSFFGIITAYIYGYFLSGEPITWIRIIGTLLIVIGNVFYISS